jgi:hypothetical protein
MWMRIILYGCNVVYLGVGLIVVGALAHNGAMTVVGAAISFSLAAALGIIGTVFMCGYRISCPICGDRGRMVPYRREVAMECVRCGLVHASPLTWRFRAIPKHDHLI